MATWKEEQLGGNLFLDVLGLSAWEPWGPVSQGMQPGPASPLSLCPPPGLSHPFSIDVFEDYIYGVTYINNRVFKIHKFGHSPLINLTGGLSHASDVVLYHQHKQPEGGSGQGRGKDQGREAWRH